MEVYEIYLPIPRDLYEECVRFYSAIGLNLASDDHQRSKGVSVGFTRHKRSAIGKHVTVCLRSNANLKEITDILTSSGAAFELIMSPDRRSPRVRFSDPAGNLLLLTLGTLNEDELEMFRTVD